MVRVTPEQYSLLQERTKGKKPKVRVKKRREELPENQVEAQITGFLQAHGWTCTKQHCGTAYRRMSTQVMFSIPKGPADWRAERPIIPRGVQVSANTCFDVELFYFEAKAPGEKPEPHQQLWLDQRQLTGITTGWFDSFEKFLRWYRQRYGVRGGDPPAKET